MAVEIPHPMGSICDLTRVNRVGWVALEGKEMGWSKSKKGGSRGGGGGRGWGLALLIGGCVALVGLQLLLLLLWSSQSLSLSISLPLHSQMQHLTTNTNTNSTNRCHLGAFGEAMASMLPEDLAFTLFLPSSSAFRLLLRLHDQPNNNPGLGNNTLAILSRVLAFSAVPQHLPAAALPLRNSSPPLSIHAVSGFNLLAWRDLDGTLVVNGIRGSECVDIRKGDLIVHVITGVLMDPEFEQSFLTDPDYDDDDHREDPGGHTTIPDLT